MNDIVIVKVINGFEDLLDRLRSIFLCKLAVFADPIKEFSSRRQLGDYIIFVLDNGKYQFCYLSVIASISNTFDSNQSWNRTMLGCFIL